MFLSGSFTNNKSCSKLWLLSPALKFYKAKSKLYRVSLAPKRDNMFIRIIAAIDSWFCSQIWFCHVLLKWYCNSLLLLSRLTRVTKKNCKNRRSESETESVTEIVGKWVGNSWFLGWPERLDYLWQNGCFGNSADTSEVHINLKLFTDFSRSNHYGTEWKRSSMWEWCYITWYWTRAEFWWWHTER